MSHVCIYIPIYKCIHDTFEIEDENVHLPLWKRRSRRCAAAHWVKREERKMNRTVMSRNSIQGKAEEKKNSVVCTLRIISQPLVYSSDRR